MSGTAIIGMLLNQYPQLHALIPPPMIKAGALPEKITLPALLLRTVSVVDWQPLKDGPSIRSTARVSATVRAASYRDQVAAIGMIRAACKGWTGDIAGYLRVSVLTAGTGPDVAGPGNSYEQTQDFRVSFDAMR